MEAGKEGNSHRLGVRSIVMLSRLHRDGVGYNPLAPIFHSLFKTQEAVKNGGLKEDSLHRDGVGYIH